MGKVKGLFGKPKPDPTELAFQKAQEEFQTLLSRDPSNVTTQELSNVGSDGPKFMLGSDDQWYLADEFEGAIKQKMEKGQVLSESDAFPKAMSIGKLAIIVGEGTSWQGELAFDDETTMNHLFKAIQQKI